jgi:AraC-like DNA-binding protein
MHPLKLAVDDTSAYSARSSILLERLRDLVMRNAPLPCMSLRARNAYVLSAVNFDTGMIAIPLQGQKRARTPAGVVEVKVGSMFLVPSPCSLDVENLTEGAGGFYMSVAVPLETHVIEAARQLLRNPITDLRQEASSVSIEDHVDDLMIWLDSLQASNFPRACHAMTSIVLRLYSEGQHHGLMYSAPPTLCARIRSMVAASPAREWSSAEIESHLGMSGASLRRHLASEGMNLREIIAEARLSHALQLLTSTRLSVKAVAQKVGYASASAFSRRFSDRFGVDPSEVNTG